MDDKQEQTGVGRLVVEAKPPSVEAKPPSVNAKPPVDKPESYGEYRKLGQPVDTVSGTTKELFEARGSGGLDELSLAFKVIAVVGIAVLVAAIILTQFAPAG